jgi:hypothetical protein
MEAAGSDERRTLRVISKKQDFETTLGLILVRSGLPAVGNIKITVSWVLTSYSLIDRYQNFRETCCLLLQGGLSSTEIHGATPQKTYCRP